MRNTLPFLLATVFGINGLAATCMAAVEIWVSPNGSDENPGTLEQPLLSPAMALRKAREMRRLKDPAVAEGIHIILRGGTHRLTVPLRVRPEDSGTEAGPTVFRSLPGETPVLSGGIPIEGWRKLPSTLLGLSSEAVENVWVADVPQFHGRMLEFRQMWVGDQKAVRAREPNVGKMIRLTGWKRDKEEAWIPKALAGPYVDSSQLEMTIQQAWEIAHLRVKSIAVEGDEACLKFHEPESRLEFEHPWPQPTMDPKGAPFFLRGAAEFLDQPGEWFLDRRAGHVYYWPREGEDLTEASVVVPALETLVEVTGSRDRPVSHVQFQGIGFQHTTWLRPSLKGHVPHQLGMYHYEAYGLHPKGTPEWRSLDNQAWVGRPPAAAAVRHVHHVDFLRCRFEHLGATGLDYVIGTHDDRIEGCQFREIGHNGIQMGCFQKDGIEIHLPYIPKDMREVCRNERIANNLITDCGNEDWGCAGIAAGYVRQCTIEHNELSNLPYSGISIGWGWTRDLNAMKDNRVVANHIHHVATHMSDTAAIYSLAAQPGSLIAENYIHSIKMSPYVHDPEHWFYLYLDEGSTDTTVKNNWCPAEKFLANATGPGNVWENNGPQVSDEVKQSAGLEPEFRDLLPEDESTHQDQSAN